jgi:hypothetical protein
MMFACFFVEKIKSSAAKGVSVMKTLFQEETKLLPEAFLETLSGEFIARSGYGAYVYLNPFDIHQMFKEYLNHPAPVREFVKQCVNSYFSA